MKKWLSRLTKIAFFLFALIAVAITVLFNMGGSNENLKGAIEDYIGQSTGYAAQIQSFNKMTFFPNIGVDMQGIILKKPDLIALEKWAEAENKKPKDERGQVAPPIDYSHPDGSVDSFKLSIGFWDASLGRTRKIKDINIKEANFKAGSIAQKAVRIEELFIDETAEGQAFLSLKGEWGDEAFTAALDLESSGSRNKRKYFLGDEGRFEAEIGGITLEGVMRPRTMGGLHIRNLKVMHEGSETLSTTFSLVRDRSGVVEVNGDFLLPENGSEGQFDWQINARKNNTITGSVEAEKIDPNDFNESSRLSRTWTAWDNIFKNPNTPANDNHNISVTAKDFQGSTFDGGAIIKDNQITFQAK